MDRNMQQTRQGQNDLASSSYFLIINTPLYYLDDQDIQPILHRDKDSMI